MSAMPPFRSDQGLTMPDSIRRQAAIFVASVLTLCGLSGCNKQANTRAPARDSTVAGALPAGHPSLTAAAELPESALLMLDSGNTAYRAKRFDVAQRYYEKAAQLAPRHGAPWFGISMIGEVTQNKRLKDSAMAEVQKRTGGMGTPPHPDSALRNPHSALPGT